MPDYRMVVPRLSDARIFEIFDTIGQRYTANGFSCGLAGVRSSANLMDAAVRSVFEGRLKAGDNGLIATAHLSYTGFRVDYYRGGEPAADRTASAIWDEIKFRNENVQDKPPLGDDIRLSIVAEISKLVGGPDAAMTALADAKVPTGVEELQGLYRATVYKLEDSFASQIAKITEWSVNSVTEMERRRQASDLEYVSLRERLQDQHQQRLDELDDERLQLEARRKELDDRDNTHVRRELRLGIQRLLTERQKNFRLSQGTKTLRMPIHLAMVSLIVALATINAVYFVQTTPLIDRASGYEVFAYLLKQGVLVAALIGSILYYVRWMNRWFEQHAAAEFANHQMQYDVDRASWVVETALEWKREQKAEIPSVLLEGISRNLFAQDGHGSTSTAADDLASALLGNAANLKLKVGDSEMNFDRKGLQELSKPN